MLEFVYTNIFLRNNNNDFRLGVKVYDPRPS